MYPSVFEVVEKMVAQCYAMSPSLVPQSCNTAEGVKYGTLGFFKCGCAGFVVLRSIIAGAPAAKTSAFLVECGALLSSYLGGGTFAMAPFPTI